MDENKEIIALIKRAKMFLEDGDIKLAREYCEKILDIEPEEHNAYLIKLPPIQTVIKII